MQPTSPAKVLRVGITFVTVILFVALLFRLLFNADTDAGGTAGSVAQINIEGIITAASPSGSFLSAAGEASSIDICEQLYSARDDSDVAAVLLRIDSPGGSAAGSDEVYRA